MVDRFVDHLDEGDRGLVLESGAGVGVDVIQQLADVVGLGGDGAGVGAHFRAREVAREALVRCRLAELVGERRVVGVDRRQEQVDPALARLGDDIVEQVEVVVGYEIAGPVGVLPVAPGAQPQCGPAQAGELGQVLVDHRFAVARDEAGHAVVGAGHDAVVRAVERDFGVGVAPADDTRLVEVEWADGRAVAVGAVGGR